MRPVILIFICFQVAGNAVSSSKSCVYQVKTRIVQTGGSVIIPCSYNGHQELGEEEQIEVRWLEANESKCQFAKNEIFSSGSVAEKYHERLFTWRDPNRNRTQYMEINGLKKTDGPLFCCQIINKQNPQDVWTSKHGTLLQYPGKKSATHLDELIAVNGENINIPCHYPKTMDSVKVTWYQVQSNVQICDTDRPLNMQQDRYSLVTSSQDFSLHIQNTNNQDRGGYCCVPSTSKILTKQVTTLLVADQELFKSRIPSEITVQKGKSVNLTCSNTLPDYYTERDVLRVNVYWRVGSVTGPYAYHPYREMVNSTYIKRTNITGIANLQIKDVKTKDNTTFHCFVTFKVCNDGDQYKDEIVYGGETRLTVKEHLCQKDPCLSTKGTHNTPAYEKNPTEGTMPPKDLPVYVIAIIIISAVLMMIIILILIVLKVKGAICERKGKISEQQMNTVQAPGNGTSSGTERYETSSKKPEEVLVVGNDNLERKVEDYEDGKLLYAKLDDTKLNDKSRAQRPQHSEEVVYADVVNKAPE